MKREIFAYLHNAGPSQMAAAFFPTMADPALVEAASAETTPGDREHREVRRRHHARIGIDISDRRPQRLTESLAQNASLLITMGCGNECPYVPGLEREDWPLLDPKNRPLSEVRQIRDVIRDRVATLI